MAKKVVAAIFMCAVMVLVAAAPMALATHDVIKGDKGPRASAVTWEYTPPSLGIWTGHIENNGLRSLVVDVYDNTGGMMDQIMHQRIRFAAYNAYPTGTVDTAGVIMAAGHMYLITVTPNGPKGSNCTVDDMFKSAIPPVAVITVVSVNYLSVAVSGSLSYDTDGSIVSYDWDFGDGSTATGVDASHTYAKDGTYTITLLVTDNEGLNGTDTKSITVSHELIPPVASFTATTVWMVVSVDASASSDNYGPIASYDWNFGDGLTGTGVTASHVYAVEGLYTITLTVTDSDGQTGMASKDVTAVKPKAPIALFTPTMTYLSVAVDGSASYDPDGTIAAYAWTFGDGASATGMTATHTYATPGVKTITLTVTDNSGMTGSVSHDVTAVKPPEPPVALFTANIVYLDVTVDASASFDPDGTIASYDWTFGDGSVATGMTATHTYALAGTYTITLTVTDNDGLTGSDAKLVTVKEKPPLEPPVAVLSVTSQLYLDVGVSGSGSSDADGTIVSYDWTFGDGSIATGMTATHSYAMAGTYTITLTVTDNDGLTGLDSKPVTVGPAIPPVAMLSVTSQKYLDVAVDSAGSYDPDGSIVSYAWTFGDGSSAVGPTATHSYAMAGTYTIVLTATDNDGLTGSASKDVTVVAAKPPVAMLSVTTQKHLYVAVDGSGSYDLDGTIVSHAWTFGDGSTAIGMTATHTYALAGTYTITLTVTDNDGLTGAASTSVTVVAAIPPVAALSVTSQKYLDVAVSGSASSDADGTIVSYAWTFGDGSVATGITATHSYAAAGTYTITLTVTDNDGLTGLASKPVTVVAAIPPVAMFSWTQKYLNVAVDGSGSSDADGTIVSYAWTFGDGSSAVGPTATHSYAAAGTYMITLTVTDNDGLTSTASGPVTVVAAIPPVAAFSVTQKYLNVAVDSAGSYDLDGTIASYAWTFGDGSIATGMTATHSYAAAGTYTITLTVTDNDGLTGSDSKPVTVVAAIPPVARFTPTASYLNVAVDGSASSDADGTIVSYDWTFGDGSIASGMTASHSYAAAGTYTITLTVTDNDGLTGSTSQQVTVTLPPPPVASFTYSVSGMTVNVDASGSSGTGLSYAWTWGDGTTGTGMTATHTYAAAKAMVVNGVSGRAPPGTPHPVFGFTTDANGNPINGCVVTVTDTRTGEFTIWDQNNPGFDPNSNIYSVDLSELKPLGWTFGDILNVTATQGTWIGWNEAPITDTLEGYDQIDVILHQAGPAPFDVTITLTVTDSFGRTATVSQTLTLYP